MKCLKKSINQDPKILADLISIVFKKDHGVCGELSEKEENRISNFYNLYYKMEFCPNETNGEIKRDELDAWIKQFNEYLKENDQRTLFGMVTGRLFAFSPVGQDKHMPCEAVREESSLRGKNGISRTTVFYTFFHHPLATASAV